MTWSVVGSKGMFGSDMLKWLETSDIRVTAHHRGNLDLTDSIQTLARELSGSEFVVNAIAYTKVDVAESERESAEFSNIEVPRKLAEACKLTGSRLIHISTDYVFDGALDAPYLPSSKPNASSVYGKTKLLGEETVLNFQNTQVIRTAWLYGANGHCFPKSIAAGLRSDQNISVVADQFGSPTHTLDLADFVLKLGTGKNTERILHGVSSGSTSWFEFAREIARTLNLDEDRVQPTSTAEYYAAATRPANSTLLPSTVAGHQIPNWLDSWKNASFHVLGLG